MSIPISKQARAILTGLVETFDAIDRVNGLEQREAQLQASVAKLNAAEAEVLAKIGDTVKGMDASRAEALAIVEQAKADAETIKAKADADAQEIMRAAEEMERREQDQADIERIKAKEALAALAAASAELEALAPKVIEAQAIIAKAERINRAMV